jgi:hypothetical protein
MRFHVVAPVRGGVVHSGTRSVAMPVRSQVAQVTEPTTT